MSRSYTYICSFLIALVLSGAVLGPVTTAEAAKISLGSSVSREEKIQQLLEEIARLQKLLDARKAATVAAADETTPAPSKEYTIYDTFYYGKSFEAIYEVDDLTLIRRDRDTSVRRSHQQMWDYFVEVIGDEEADHYVDELRIFNKPSSSIGAFVELRTRNKDQFWIVGINEDDFVFNDPDTEETYSTLFVHEYAHLLTFGDYPELVDTFADQFWTDADERHARKIADFEGNDLDNALEDYYAKNKGRFVSDYATSNKDEDFAETFTQFVFDERPAATRTIRDQKIDFMYRYAVLTQARDRLRANLGLD